MASSLIGQIFQKEGYFFIKDPLRREKKGMTGRPPPAKTLGIPVKSYTIASKEQALNIES